MKKRTIIILMFIMLFSGTLFPAEFKWARMKFNLDGARKDSWKDEASADLIMLKSLLKYSTVKLKPEMAIVTPDKLEEMCKYPFIFMHAQTPIILTDAEVANIREYLDRGGFIFVDDCVLSPSEPDLFFKSVLKELKTRIYADGKILKLENNHPIFSCFFNMAEGVPTMQGVNHGGWAVFDKKDKMKVFLVSTDIQCGWNPEYFPGQRNTEALKMGMNIVIYALTH